jgi:hypothetical protein
VILDLFDLSAVSPATVGQVVATARSGVLDLRGLNPCAQLAVFSELRARQTMSEERLDRIMTEWLSRLGTTRTSLN